MQLTQAVLDYLGRPLLSASSSPQEVGAALRYLVKEPHPLLTFEDHLRSRDFDASPRAECWAHLSEGSRGVLLQAAAHLQALKLAALRPPVREPMPAVTERQLSRVPNSQRCPGCLYCGISVVEFPALELLTKGRPETWRPSSMDHHVGYLCRDCAAAVDRWGSLGMGAAEMSAAIHFLGKAAVGAEVTPFCAAGLARPNETRWAHEGPDASERLHKALTLGTVELR